MKKVWVMAIVVTLAMTTLGIGFSMALFSDSTAVSTSNIVAGTLELSSNRDQGDSINGPMFYTTEAQGWTYDGILPPVNPPDGPGPTGYWAPGDEHERVLQVENIGSLDGLLTKIRAVKKSGDDILANKLQVRVVWLRSDYDFEGNVTTTEVEVASGTLRNFIDADQEMTSPIEIYPGDVIDLHFYVELPLDANNDYQEKDLDVGFTVYAEQMANNPRYP